MYLQKAVYKNVIIETFVRMLEWGLHGYWMSFEQFVHTLEVAMSLLCFTQFEGCFMQIVCSLWGDCKSWSRIPCYLPSTWVPLRGNMLRGALVVCFGFKSLPESLAICLCLCLLAPFTKEPSYGPNPFLLKSSFSGKATKIWKNLPLALTLLSKNSCFVKTFGRFL